MRASRCDVGAAHVRAIAESGTQVCADLKWFLVRFPLDVKPVEALDDGASRHHERILTLSKIVGSKQGARSFEMAVPSRAYQRLAAETWLAARGLLLADD